MTDGVESEHVGALMDIGVRLKRLNELSVENQGHKFGAGYLDLFEGDDPRKAHAAAMAMLSEHPDVWYTVLRANLELTKISDSPEMLEKLVTQVAALATAWLTDLRERTTATNS